MGYKVFVRSFSVSVTNTIVEKQHKMVYDCEIYRLLYTDMTAAILKYSMGLQCFKL